MAAASLQEDGQSARAADCGQGTRLLPEQAEVRSTPEFISYRYLTIAAAYHRGAGWSRSMVSAALPGGLPEQKMTAPRIAWVLSYTIAAEPGVFAPHDLAPCPTASAPASDSCALSMAAWPVPVATRHRRLRVVNLAVGLTLPWKAS
jgi:hypothetical protein